MPTCKLIDGALTPYTEEAPVEITLAAWREGARPEAGRFALVLPNDASILEVVESIGEFSAIILDFPTFRDGRAYSQARLLRERCGFRGEIRARGDVLSDQAYFMARAGFDAFEIDGAKAAAFSDALGEFSVVYQRAADAAEPIWRRRLARAMAA